MTTDRWGHQDLRKETVMILVCGATGDLGGRIVRLLIREGQQVRAFVRPATDATWLQAEGVEVAGRVETAPAQDRQPDLWCFSGSGPEPLHRVPELWLF